ncbi:acyl-CoA dehydrogenase family protein [Rhodococcus rhodochrous]|uniref:acyl-CoA dehydrogenase family protein n=1 Tax=Rhodococcus rhodochrous TaxID=1829 RepID=UPI000314C660|nr:acyl-CoA dehydrogenase family protein [Rhodococcus rhodochrous]
MFDGLPVRHDGWLDSFVAEAEKLAEEYRDEIRTCTREGRFPAEVFREMGRRGWVGPVTSKESGGLGGGVGEYCAIEETAARYGLASPQTNIQGQLWLQGWGTDEQRERYLRPFATGEMVFSESISEPGVGSSLKLMQSTATRDGSDWILRGQKTHVNLGVECDVTLFFAMAEEGLTAFFVDMSEGVRASHSDPIGYRISPTADMFFEDIRVPQGAVLGEPGQGMQVLLGTFNISRLGNASALLGWGRRAMAEAVAYGREREVGGSMVTDFQGIQWTVADCYAELYAASLARNQAAATAEAGQDPALGTSMAKMLAIRAAEHAVNEAFALTGGYGLYHDTDFGQLMHDVKVLRIAGGSLEVLRNYVARRVLRAPREEGL